MKKKISVCMSVYHGDNAEHFRLALDSILDQTLVPDEIVLVVDGPINSDINEVIDDYSNRTIPFRVIRMKKNMGHAISRETGVNAASYDYIAIMDSDDFSVRERFQKQITIFEEHPELDIVGGQIMEFVGTPENIIGKRIVPCDNNSICNYMKRRCPFNQPTVMFRKQAVIDAGNYQHWFWNEDYYLWIRMMLNNCKMANLPDVLVKMRTGRDQYARRGGLKYFRSEEKLQRYMLKKKVISLFQYLYNVTGRFVIQVIMPNKLRGLIFRLLFRKH